MYFNRQQLVGNIGSLIQQRGMKIGEVETAIGISAGYLSRLAKDGNSSIPATDVTWKLAQHLGVSTDALISGDYSTGTDNLSVLKRFLKKLIVRTIEGSIDWIPVTTKYVNAVLKGDEDSFFLVKEKDKDYGVPKFDPEDNFSESTMTYSCYHNRRIVSAASPLDPTWMTGNGFKAKLNEKRWVFLFPLCVSFDTGTPAGSVEQDYFEMDMLDWTPDGGLAGAAAALSGTVSGHWVEKPVFDTFKSSYAPLEEDVKDLYDTASRNAFDVKLNASVKSAILDFLDDESVEEE